MRGFTIIELAIVLIILSLIMGAGVRYYGIYLQRKQVEDNANSILEIAEGIDKYFLEIGHFPCPAPWSAGPGDAGYGESMDCSDTTPGDYQLATRNIDLDKDGIAETVRIRTGTFPFLEITNFLMDNPDLDFGTGAFRLGKREALDAYGRQFTYVVTERQATPNYIDHFGAIRLEDEYGRVVAENTNYILVSHGQNGSGARLLNGAQLPCTGTGIDLENCDGDFEFVRSLQYHTAGAGYYDDVVARLQWIPFFLWGQSVIDPADIRNLNPGNVGVGVKDPQEQLHIKDGDLVSYYVYDDIGHTSSQNICADDGSDCFPAELIGGDTFPECNQVDEVMEGIANRVPVCVAKFSGNFTRTCPANSYVSALEYNAITKIFTVKCKDPTFGR